MSTVHDVKCWPIHFQALKRGDKTGEIRKDDRDYQVGHVFRPQEWNPETQEYTGDSLDMEITHVLRGAEAERFGLQPGYCMLSVRRRVVAPYEATNKDECHRTASEWIKQAAGLCASACGALTDGKEPATGPLRHKLLDFRHELNSHAGVLDGTLILVAGFSGQLHAMRHSVHGPFTYKSLCGRGYDISTPGHPSGVSCPKCQEALAERQKGAHVLI